MEDTFDINDLELSVRVRNRLPRRITLQQFLDLSEIDVIRTPGLSRKSWYEIRQMQEHLRGPSREDQITALRSALRVLRTKAESLGLTLEDLA